MNKSKSYLPGIISMVLVSSGTLFMSSAALAQVEVDALEAEKEVFCAASKSLSTNSVAS